MKTDIQKLATEAAQGYVDAQFELAHFHDSTRNHSEAVKWYRKAAEQNYADAQFGLARCYDTGKGVRKDDVEAAKWYRKAAEQGHAEAQCELGRCYTKGKGVKADYNEAERWFSAAFDQGHFATESDLAELNTLLEKSFRDGTLKYRELERLEKPCEEKKTPRRPRKKYNGPFAGLVNPLVELWDMIVPEDANFFEWVILAVIYVVIASGILAVSLLFFVFQVFQVLFLVEGIRGLAHGRRCR